MKDESVEPEPQPNLFKQLAILIGLVFLWRLHVRFEWELEGWFARVQVVEQQFRAGQFGALTREFTQKIRRTRKWD